MTDQTPLTDAEVDAFLAGCQPTDAARVERIRQRLRDILEREYQKAAGDRTMTDQPQNAIMVTIHYGSLGQAECGAAKPEILTTVPAHVTCQTCRGWLPIVAPRLCCRAPAPDRSGRTCDKPNGHNGPHWTYGGTTLTWWWDLPRRLGLMAEAMVSAKVGPQARFFTRERVDEIVVLLREAEKHILGEGEEHAHTHRTMIDQPDIVKKAWKLIEAIAEPCEHRDDEDHSWRRCRRCLAVQELETKTGRQLVGIIQGEGATIGVLRAQVAALRAENQKLKDDNDHLHLANQGAHHYRCCSRNVAAGGDGGGDFLCTRCEAEQAEAENRALRAGLASLVEQWGADDGAHGSELAALLRRTE